MGLSGRFPYAGKLLFDGVNIAALFAATPCPFCGLIQGVGICPGDIPVAFARTAFRLRFISRNAATPVSNAPNKTAMAAISRGWPGEPDEETPVVVSPLLPVFVPLLVGVWPFPTVGDAAGAVALAPAVVVIAGIVVVVGVTPGVMVGEGLGDGCGVGEGDTIGAE